MGRSMRATCRAGYLHQASVRYHPTACRIQGIVCSHRRFPHSVDCTDFWRSYQVSRTLQEPDPDQYGRSLSKKQGGYCSLDENDDAILRHFLQVLVTSCETLFAEPDHGSASREQRLQPTAGREGAKDL